MMDDVLEIESAKKQQQQQQQQQKNIKENLGRIKQI
jgi:hypothetical protein